MASNKHLKKKNAKVMQILSEYWRGGKKPQTQKTSINLVPNPDNDIIRKLQTNVAHEHRCNNP